MASVYKRGDTWWVKYFVRGRPVYKSLKTKKKNEALKLKAAIEAQLIERPGELENIDSLVDVFWPAYINWARDHKRPRTLEAERLSWAKFMSFAKPTKLGDVTPATIEGFKAKRKQEGLKPQSINDALRTLGTIFNYAIKLGYFSGPNPFKCVKRYKLSRNPPRFLNKEQIAHLLGMAEKHNRNIYWVMALGIYAGLRRNEIGCARWEWFDFKNKTITLCSYDGFELKDREARTVPLHDKLAEILGPYKQDEGFVFAEAKSSDYRYRYDFKRSFGTVCKIADLPWVTPHVLRHTFASQLAMAGVSLYKIAKWMGHSDVKTTQVYAHLQSHDEDINRF